MTGKKLAKSQLLKSGSHLITMRLGMWLPDAFPFVYLCGFPKSGTTWIGQLVADYMRLSFPQGAILPIGHAAVIHNHYKVRPSFRRCVYVMRDGRDVMTSLYFFLVRPVPEGDNPTLTPRLRKLFPVMNNRDNVGENLPAFIENQARDPHSTSAHWGDHLRSYYASKREGVAGARYEDFLVAPHETLSRLISDLTGETPDEDRINWAVQKYSFERMSGRKPGQEVSTSFHRKGQAGDWKNHFSREAAEVFDRYFGDMLIEAGYETDRSWLESVAAPAEVGGAA